jgi:MFS family permease
MSYRQEARTRVLYFSAVFVVSVVVGLIVAAIIATVFSNANHNSHYRIFGYSWFIVSAIVSGVLVYKVDQVLNKRFNQNP